MNYKQIKELDDKMPIVSITGTIKEVNEPKKEGKEFPVMRQTVMIEDSNGDLIRVKLSEKHQLPLSSIGDSVSFFSKKNGDKLTGIMKKSQGNKVYVSVTDSASFLRNSLAKPEKDKVIHLNENKEELRKIPKGPSDSIILKILHERLYIYGIMKKELSKIDSLGFPEDKLPELATSIHITIERSGKDILPSGGELLFKKQTRNEQIKEVASAAINDEWKDVLHPSTKKRLGDFTKDELIEKFSVFYYKNKDRKGLEDNVAQFISGLGMALRSFGITVTYAIEKMIKDEVTNSISPDEVVMLVAKDKAVDAQLAKTIVCNMMAKTPMELSKYLKSLVDEKKTQNEGSSKEEDSEKAEDQEDHKVRTYKIRKQR